MKNKILFGVLVILITICGCSKTTDNAPSWVGVYTGTGLSSPFNQITITEASKNTLKIQLQIVSGGTAYSYVTLNTATLPTATTVTVNENGNLLGSNDQWKYTGSGTLTGNTLLLTGQGTDLTTDSVKLYYFTGNK